VVLILTRLTKTIIKKDVLKSVYKQMIIFVCFKTGAPKTNISFSYTLCLKKVLTNVVNYILLIKLKKKNRFCPLETRIFDCQELLIS
jgi:hypothetical protein